MLIVDTFIAGSPKTKGSMDVVNKRTGQLREGVVGSSAWRALMAQGIRDDMARRGTTTVERNRPVAVEATFWLPPPHLQQPWISAIWERSGDVDKLTRNLLDACGTLSRAARYNGGAFVDDVQVVQLSISKFVEAGWKRAGVEVVVRALG